MSVAGSVRLKSFLPVFLLLQAGLLFACSSVAWWSKTDFSRPMDQSTDRDGHAQFYAPPRGYVVYAITSR